MDLTDQTNPTTDLSFGDYQAAAVKTAIYPEGSIAYLVLGLNGEAGEVAEIVKRHIRGSRPLEASEVDRIALELGDCLWYIANAAHVLGLELAMIARANLAKLRDRKERGVLDGKGDKR